MVVIFGRSPNQLAVPGFPKWGEGGLRAKENIGAKKKCKKHNTGILGLESALVTVSL